MEPQEPPRSAWPWTPSTLAVAPEGVFFAAGTTPGPDSEEKPLLRILSTQRRGLLEVVATFTSPAPFCRVAWSRALAYGTSSTSPVGLIAGGLDSGAVMVWDPQHKLRDREWNSKYYEEEEMLATKYLQEGCFMTSDAKLIDDYFGPEKLREPPVLPPRLTQTARNLLTPGAVTPGMVAAFRDQSSPVRGLAFSSFSPALLASGAEGKVMVLDLSNQLAKSVPMFQYISSPSMNISSLAWSKFLPSILACTSFGGRTSVLDLRSKSPILSGCECGRRCSAVDFSPVDENSLVVACDDCSPLPSLMVWDIRSMTEPVSTFCQDSGGVNAMSWNQWNDHALVVTTNNSKAIVFDVQNQQAIVEMETPNRCFDVHWRNTWERTFVAASNKELAMYRLE